MVTKRRLMGKVALFLNGQSPKEKPDLSQFSVIYCTDGAYNYLKTWNLKPNVICGDFDSFDKSSTPEDVEIVELPDQNFTDFEKALGLLKERGYHDIYIYGSSGMEHDHFLGNLSAALKYKNELNLIFFDDYSCYFFAEKSTRLDGYNGRTISLYPFPLAKGISTKGLKFPLKNEDLEISTRVGTRNLIIEDKACVDFKDGNLLLFIKNSID